MDRLPIIFLHGILNNRDEGWRAAGAARGWPEIAQADTALGDAEVLALKYETGVGSINLDLREIGKNLWKEIKDRKFHLRPALVIVGYSMGGIIARKMLVDHLDELGAETVVGLLLVGSPSRGSGWARLVAGPARWVGHDQALALLAAGNRFLEQLYDQFNDLRDKRTVVGASLVEQYNMFLRFLPPIVSTASAQAHFTSSKIEGSDHSTICKPASAEAQQHKELRRLMERVREEVAKLAAPARERITATGLADLLAQLELAGRVKAAGMNPDAIVAEAQLAAPDLTDPLEARGVIEAVVGDRLRMRTEAVEGTNLGDLVDSAVKAIDARTEAGEFEAAAAEAETWVARWETEEAERVAQRAEAGRKLLDEAIAARLRIPDVPGAAVLVERRCALEPDPAEARGRAWWEWHWRGSKSGLRPQLRLARTIAERALRDAVATPEDEVWWANSLGTTLRELGLKETANETLDAALAAFESAAGSARVKGLTVGLAVAQSNRASVLTQLAQRTRSPETAEKAVSAADEAVALFGRFDPGEVAENLAVAWGELGNARFVLGGDVGSDEKVLADAIAAFDEEARLAPPGTDRVARANSLSNRANAVWALGKLRADPATVREAIAGYAAAVEAYGAEKATYLQARTVENLAEARETLAGMVPGERDALLAEALDAARKAVAAYEAVGATFDVESARRVVERLEAARGG